jgi:hypothetical protein
MTEDEALAHARNNGISGPADLNLQDYFDIVGALPSQVLNMKLELDNR